MRAPHRRRKTPRVGLYRVTSTLSPWAIGYVLLIEQVRAMLDNDFCRLRPPVAWTVERIVAVQRQRAREQALASVKPRRYRRHGRR